MSGDRVRFSARVLQELLAGRIDQERFLKAHGFIPDEFGKTISNPFDRALAQGKLIDKIEVEKDPDNDDDWIWVYFGDRDPAVSNVTMPTAED